jgi:hypothetical protein
MLCAREHTLLYVKSRYSLERITIIHVVNIHISVILPALQANCKRAENISGLFMLIFVEDLFPVHAVEFFMTSIWQNYSLMFVVVTYCHK